MIEFHDVSAWFGTYGLKNITFQIKKTDIHLLTVLDTNTLMALFDVLTNRAEITSGQLLADGRPYAGTEGIQYIQSSQGYVIRELTVAQNVYGFGKKKGFLFSNRAAEAECRKLLGHFGFRMDPEDTLLKSSVEDQRIVELLRCYVRRPRILVLNELFDIFSFQNIALAKNLLSEMRMQGTYVIYITRKFDDIFKLGDVATVFRDGRYVDTLDRAEIMRHPYVLYEALLGRDTVLYKEQFDLGGEDFDILDVVKIGTQYMFAQENVSTALGKYAHITENYFRNARCIIYLRNDESQQLFRTVVNAERSEDEVPVTNDETIMHLLEMEGFYTITQADGTMIRPRTSVFCDTLLYAKIEAGGHAAGILQVSFPTSHTLTQKDIDFLHVTCDEIAMMIENAKLMGRSAFLQESHHRIKNNLQMITSMLILQKSRFRQSASASFDLEEVETFIDTTINRIQSIAGIHDLLSRAIVRDELVTLQAILAEIQKFYGQVIHMEVNVRGYMPIPHLRSTAIALVINEIISNSVKHNAGREDLRCTLEAWMEDKTVYMRYRDNGGGLDPNRRGTGIGTTLINAIVQSELEGEIHMGNHPEGGILVELQFSMPSLY